MRFEDPVDTVEREAQAERAENDQRQYTPREATRTETQPRRQTQRRASRNCECDHCEEDRESELIDEILRSVCGVRDRDESADGETGEQADERVTAGLHERNLQRLPLDRDRAEPAPDATLGACRSAA